LKSILENIENATETAITLAMRAFLDDLENEKLFDAMIERQMNSFLVSFANYHNNKYKRKGGLFQKPFRRIQICDDSHLQQAVIYVNANAQKHNLINDFRQYPYSSYNEVIQNTNKFIDTKAVLSFFGGIENFIAIHKRQVEYYYGADWPSSKIE
jgi:hypothetical protein